MWRSWDLYRHPSACPKLEVSACCISRTSGVSIADDSWIPVQASEILAGSGDTDHGSSAQKGKMDMRVA